MFWGSIFVLVGVGLLLQSFGVIPKDVAIFWPVVLIAFGLSLIFRRKDFWSVYLNDRRKK